jgi:hypothetical protein
MKLFQLLVTAIALLASTGCENMKIQRRTSGPVDATARAAVVAGIAAEPKGAYYVGRRYFKTEYKFWGWVRRSGESWANAKLVVMNERSKFIPDREAGKPGSDNNVEYKLQGDFSGDTIYEPASNGFYPEFVLRSYEVLSTNPGPIYKDAGATDPSRRIIAQPY